MFRDPALIRNELRVRLDRHLGETPCQPTGRHVGGVIADGVAQPYHNFRLWYQSK